MIKTFCERFSELFQRSHPVVNEHTTLHALSSRFPYLFDFIERKYGLPVTAADQTLSLAEFSHKYGLPPSPILFMEIQMDEKTQKVVELPPSEAKHLLVSEKQIKLLDVRESWEMKLCALKGSQALSPQLLDELLTDWPKEAPILVYCHHGVRSLDAAIFLADRGFLRVYTIRGGIDAWSVQVDPQIPQYDGQYC